MRRRTVTGIDEAGIKLVVSNAVEFLRNLKHAAAQAYRRSAIADIE